jgi:hypothetical protein
MTLRTRAGFYGVTEEEADRGRPVITDQVNLALLSPFGAQDFELSLNSFFANGNREGSIIRSFIYLNAADLSFASVNGRREALVEVHGAVFGDNGVVIDRVKRDVALAMDEAQFQKTMSKGLFDEVRLRFDMSMKKPGSYQVRIAVRDRTSSKIGSAGQFVAVPDVNDKRLAVSGIVLRNVSQFITPAAVMANPSVRRFATNSDLHFAFVVYNAALNQATQLPNLTIETRLFRDGKSVGPSLEVPIEVKNQTDVSRLFVNGSLRLNPALAPGDYYLQVVITDKVTRARQSQVTQWVDLEIVK